MFRYSLCCVQRIRTSAAPQLWRGECLLSQCPREFCAPFAFLSGVCVCAHYLTLLVRLSRHFSRWSCSPRQRFSFRSCNRTAPSVVLFSTSPEKPISYDPTTLHELHHLERDLEKFATFVP